MLPPHRSTSSNSFHARNPFPMVLWSEFFTSATMLSNCPPHQGARLRLNCQVILFFARWWFSFSSFITFFSQLAAPTNVVPLSEYIFCGLPFLTMNLFRLKRNSWVSREVIRSKYNAQLKEQAYNAMYAFPFAFPRFR